MDERKYTCPWCGESVTASSGIRINKRVYHNHCYDAKIKEETEKQRRKKERETKVKESVKKLPLEIPEAVSEDDAKAREHFFKKIKELTGNEKLSAKTYALADRYKKEYEDFTWIGMEKTLVYVFELSSYTIEDDLVGIIPWKYSEAKEFYEALDAITPVKEPLKDLYTIRKIKICPKSSSVPNIDISQLGV